MLSPVPTRTQESDSLGADRTAVPTYGGPVRAAWAALAAVCLAIAAALIADEAIPGYTATLRVLSAAVWIGSGALLVLRARPSRLVLLTGAMLLAQGLAPAVDTATAGGPDAWVGRLATAVALSLAVLTLAVLPDGRFVPGWLRWTSSAFVLWELATVVLGPLHGTADVVGGFVFFLGIGIPIGAQVHRYRRMTDPAMRNRMKWVVYGISVAITVELLVSLPYLFPGWSGSLVDPGSPYDRFQDAVSTLGLLVIPVCLTAAMVSGGLFDVDVVISRTLVYGGLTLAVTAGYLAIVSTLGLLVDRRGDQLSPLVAVAVIAVLFGPLRSWLQQRARRLVYGLRAEPYAALTELGRRLSESMPSEEVPARLVDTVRRSLRVPWVAVGIGADGDFPIAAESGARTTGQVSVPVLHRGEQVGLLLIGYDDRRPLPAADRRLLSDLAHQLGSSIHGVQLTEGLRRGAAELQAARERLVLAREEERRRIRRDLHDGLAPTLASAGLQLSTAADLRRRDPDAGDRVLQHLERTLQGAVADVRALVDGLRPPALDELGLVRAVGDRAEELRPAMEVTVTADDRLPPLPAAIEVAAYRICQEALMNVRTHSGARRVRVCLSAGTSLQLRVEDDGVGVRQVRPGGVGLASMRERAREVGGECVVEDGLWDDGSRGTTVRMTLPLHAHEELA
jgi:signal transduction histidine kinase